MRGDPWGDGYGEEDDMATIGELDERVTRREGPTVLAFLFAQPDSAAIQMLDQRGEYLDVRTGGTWDLFFPGYYRSGLADLERHTGAVPVGAKVASNWYFRAKDFNTLRAHIEMMSDGRWNYSGGAELVLINAVIVDGAPTVDWASTQGWDVTDNAPGGQGLSLAKVVESITHDFETDAEDPSYGLRKQDDRSTVGGRGSGTREFMVHVVTEIAVALGLKAMGA